jgi:hypothetical protein
MNFSPWALVLASLAWFAPEAVRAQSIICPGALPVAIMAPERSQRLAARQLDRFVSALDLRGIEAIDQERVLAAYGNHPEQLLAKLQYLSLQCQIVALEPKIEGADRVQVVRRVFVDYVSAPPDDEAADLATYVNSVAASGHGETTDETTESLISTVESEHASLARRGWEKRYFPEAGPAGQPGGKEDSERWSVIVASPRYEDEGWEQIARHQKRWSGVYFELHGPHDVDSPHYAVVAGRRLTESGARTLLDEVRAMGMAEDAYVWEAPASDGGLVSAKR